MSCVCLNLSHRLCRLNICDRCPWQVSCSFTPPFGDFFYYPPCQCVGSKSRLSHLWVCVGALCCLDMSKCWRHFSHLETKRNKIKKKKTRDDEEAFTDLLSVFFCVLSLLVISDSWNKLTLIARIFNYFVSLLLRTDVNELWCDIVSSDMKVSL